MTNLSSVFNELREILLPFTDALSVKIDVPDQLYVDTRFIQKNKQPLFFAAVQIKKSYVSYHLMPIYQSPNLLTDVSDALKSRMQGKSCFNFKSVEPALFAELKQLTEAGLDAYRTQGFV